jgi:hypothetical protein
MILVPQKILANGYSDFNKLCDVLEEFAEIKLRLEDGDKAIAKERLDETVKDLEDFLWDECE